MLFTRLILSMLTGVALFAIAPAAVARPRDDVMSNAFRCAAIGDMRTWLDCYYGAAQPAREALNLPSAPAGQLKLASNPPHGTAPANDTDLRDHVLSRAFACKAAGDDRQWLSCYYAAAEPARAELGLASLLPRPAARTAGPDVPFGTRAARPLEIPDSADHLATSMVSYTFNTYGIFTVALGNGQVWKQVAGDTSYAHWTKPASTYRVRLTHGALGSYDLAVVGMPGVFKVRRAQ